jgi:predicted ATP-dependent endonuclease of OLD family
MRIQFVEIQNFRKLKSIRIDFDPETTLFAGANNSGKTSAIHALSYFLLNKSGFNTNDFTLSNWAGINEIGSSWENLANQGGPAGLPLSNWEFLLPSLDIWLNVAEDEIHYVSHLLPGLDWEGGLLGLRLRLEPKEPDELFKEYISARVRVKEVLKAMVSSNDSSTSEVALWPRTMQEFLERRLGSVLTVRGYSLDPKNEKKPQNGIASPQALPPGSLAIEGDPLKGLIQIDVIYAQRDFADVNSGERRAIGQYRSARRLSAQLRTYYDKHLNPQEAPEPSDLGALKAIQEAEKIFDVKLRNGFSGALKEVEGLGYPGVSDPKLTIATKIRLIDGLDHNAAVQYDVVSGNGSDEALRLPEGCNGLGYQNLISIVFELMSFRDGWMQVGKAGKAPSVESEQAMFPPPLHLILIEEPEAHLHAQVQQVFIRKAYQLLRNHDDLGSNTKLTTQLVVSTHSSHVAHESEFSSLRYFRRRPALKSGDVPTTTVVNLSEVFGDTTTTQRFVTRYLKATHCDLFFADAAILVEGPAERILVPQFVYNDFRELSQAYLTLLEIGGSHAHRLRPLIEHLGLVTLVITDLDAAASPGGAGVTPSRNNQQVTRNATLKTWLPAIESLDDLLDCSDNKKIKKYDDFFSVRVAYQCPLQIQLRGSSSPIEVLPNTFEDALAYDNLNILMETVVDGEIGRLRETLASDGSNTAAALEKNMFDYLKTAKKAELALDLLGLERNPWPIKPPTYIRQGLSWLEQELRQKQLELLSSGAPPLVETGLAK